MESIKSTFWSLLDAVLSDLASLAIISAVLLLATFGGAWLWRERKHARQRMERWSTTNRRYPIALRMYFLLRFGTYRIPEESPPLQVVERPVPPGALLPAINYSASALANGVRLLGRYLNSCVSSASTAVRRLRERRRIADMERAERDRRRALGFLDLACPNCGGELINDIAGADLERARPMGGIYKFLLILLCAAAPVLIIFILLWLWLREKPNPGRIRCCDCNYQRDYR